MARTKSFAHIDGRQRILLHLYEHDCHQFSMNEPNECTQASIASSVLLRHNSVSCALKALLKDGLVERRAVRVDQARKRKGGYFLTLLGIEAARKVLLNAEGAIVKVRLGGELVTATLKDALRIINNGLTMTQAITMISPDGIIEPISKHGLHEKYGFIHDLQEAPRVARFFGRRSELARLQEWFKGDEPIIVLHGLAGMGKSTLVAVFATWARNRTHVLWHNGRLNDSPRTMLDLLSRFLQQTGASEIGSYLAQSEPIESMVLGRLTLRGTNSHPMLFIIDDAHVMPPETLTALVQIMIGSPWRTKLLLVSRNPLATISARGSYRLAIDSLDRESALTMLSLALAPAVERERALALSKGVPMLLAIFSSGTYISGGVGKAALGDVVGALSPEETHLLSFVSLARKACERRLVIEHCRAHPAVIDSLVQRSLLIETQRDRYAVHEVVRGVTLETMSRNIRIEIHSALAEGYIAIGTPASSIEALHHTLCSGRFDRVASILSERGKTLVEDGYVGALYDIVRRIPLRRLKRRDRIVAMLWLGKMNFLTWRLPNAVRWFVKVVESRDDRQELMAEVHLNLGNLYTAQNKWAPAIANLKSAIELGKSYHLSTYYYAGMVGLSTSYRRIGRYEEALKLAGDCLEQATLEGRLDMKAVACLYKSIALFELGRKGEAKRMFRIARRNSEHIRPLRDRAIQWYHLGMMLRLFNEPKDAILYLEKAAEVSKGFGEVRLHAHTLHSLCGCYHGVGESERSIKTGRDGLSFAKALGDFSLATHFETMLAGILADVDQPDEAERLFKHSLSTLKRSGMVYYYVTTLARYAQMQVNQGKVRVSRTIAECRRLYTKIGSKDGLRRCDELERKYYKTMG
ncbi:MAG: AAA family ATPase [Euryarchaeota archaeon]|nr:AAA family ATPase [Euryarchaeota archaeon]